MVDYFSEPHASTYIRIAAVVAVVSGLAEVVMALIAPQQTRWWSIVEGGVVVGLASGLWRRKLAAAVALLVIKVVGVVVWVTHSGGALRFPAIVQLLVYSMAATAIQVGRQRNNGAASRSGPGAAPGG